MTVQIEERDITSIFIESITTSSTKNIDMIDWSKFSHEYAINKLEGLIKSLSELKILSIKVNITHGSTESGIDLITIFPECNYKIGWQIKSFADHNEPSFNSSTLAQIQRSRKYRCNAVVIIHCTDPIKHARKIRAVDAEINQTDPDYVWTISPENFFNVLNEDLWKRIRERALSWIVGKNVSNNCSLDPYDHSPLNPVIKTDYDMQFTNLTAKQYYDQGIEKINSKDYPEAIICFEKSLTIEESAYTHNSIGNIYLLNNIINEAIKHYNYSIKLDPKYPSPFINKAIAYKKMNKIVEAENTINECLSLHPYNDEAVTIYFKILNYKKQYNKVLEYVKERQICVDKKSVSYLLPIAEAAVELCDYQCGINIYTLINKKENGRSFFGAYGLGHCHFRKKEFEAAIIYLKNALDIKIDSGVLFQLGTSYLELKQYSEACEYLQLAREMNHSSIPILGNLANVLREMGRYFEAIQCYQEIIKNKPDDVLVWENIGACYRQTGMYQESLMNYEIAIRLSPQQKDGLFNNAAIAAMEIGDYNKAEIYEKNAIKLNPNNEKCHHVLGMIYYRQKKYDYALKEFLKTERLGVSAPDLFTEIGIIYMLKNKIDNANKYLKKALEINSTFAPAIGTLGQLNKRIGNTEKAQELFNKAMDLDPSLDFVHEENSK